MNITTTIEQAEAVAFGLHLMYYETTMVGGESVILVSEKTAEKICKQYNTTACEHGKSGQWALTNLGKFLTR